MAADARTSVRLELQPCRLIDSLLVEDSSRESVIMTWGEFCQTFDIVDNIELQTAVRAARPGTFIGIMTPRYKPDQRVMFCLSSDGGKKKQSIEWIERQQRGFKDRLHEVYRLKAAHWGGEVLHDSHPVEELGGGSGG